MKISILTLFPEMFVGPFDESIIKRAKEKGLVEINLINIRDFGIGRHKVVDDKPYGGGVGMVMKVDVLDKAIQFAKVTKKHQPEADRPLDEKVILLDARGQTFVQSTAKTFSQLKHLILLCGHYEGIDERVRKLVDMTISVGDFILTGGEISAMLVTDAVARLIPGVLKEDATLYESFSLTSQTDYSKQTTCLPAGKTAVYRSPNAVSSLLEYPQYTMPQDYNGEKVPDILLSGNHQEIATWRREKSLEITTAHRPDLLKNFNKQETRDK